MFSTLRNRFGIPGVISVIALVFAMLGGAYAASSDNGTGKATASAKAKRGPRGPKGPAGPAGPQGPAGLQGAPGAKGDTGAAGSNGTNGTNGSSGANGKSVTLTTEPAGTNCPETGGTKVEVEGTPASKKFVCNGKNGVTGFTETLPPGETETGAWATSVYDLEGFQAVMVPISFPIPLPASSPNAHFLNEEETDGEAGTGGCTGTVEHPTAPPGVLCIYTSGELKENVGSPSIVIEEKAGYFPTGTVLTFESTASGFILIAGTWAVTAPTS